MGLIKDVFKEWKFGVALLIIIAVCAYVLLASAVVINTEITCLKYGYPGHQVMANLKAYCSRVENGSTVIVDMYDLKEGEK